MAKKNKLNLKKRIKPTVAKKAVEVNRCQQTC